MKRPWSIGIEVEEENFGFGVSDGTMEPFMNVGEGDGPGPSDGEFIKPPKIKPGTPLTGCTSCIGPGSGSTQPIYNLRTNLYVRNN